MDESLLSLGFTIVIWILSFVTVLCALWGVIRSAVLSALRTHAREQAEAQAPAAAKKG